VQFTMLPSIPEVLTTLVTGITSFFDEVPDFFTANNLFYLTP